MPNYSLKSQAALATCHPDLIKVFNEVIKHFDCVILEGHRDEEAQNKAFNEGKSKLKWPHGKHNQKPSLAVDVVPFPIDWNDLNRIRYFAGYVMGVAATLGVEMRR